MQIRKKLGRAYRAGMRRLSISRLVRNWLDRLWATDRGLRLLLRMRDRPLLLSAYYHHQKAFHVEQRAVFSGKLRYHLDMMAEDGRPVYLLRRNIHRIEKGLATKNRKVSFAEGYIKETVLAYERLFAASESQAKDDDPLQKWAHDVLCTYFQSVLSNPTIDGAKQRFQALPSPREVEGPEFVPFRPDPAVPPAVDYKDLLELARHRKSVRAFLSKPVPRECIDRAIQVGAMAPSACNRQPFKFHVFDEPTLVERIFSLPMGTKGFSQGIPTLVVIVAEASAFFDERDRYLVYIDASLAAMAFVLALETQGLASCCINWPDIAEKEEELCRFMGLEPYQRGVMLIAVGYPDPEGMVACSARTSLDLLRRYNLDDR